MRAHHTTLLFLCSRLAQIRLIVIIAHATLETALAFMNHFPLFAVMLRLKDPSRLPGDSYHISTILSADFVLI